MYRTNLQQIKTFHLTNDKEANDFVIKKFIQCGIYAKIIPQMGYIAVIWDDLVECDFQPPAKVIRVEVALSISEEDIPSGPIPRDPLYPRNSRL